MSRCQICGKEIPDLPVMELCQAHTDQFIEFVRRAKE